MSHFVENQHMESKQKMIIRCRQRALAQNVSAVITTAIIGLKHAHVHQTHTIFSLESFGFAN